MTENKGDLISREALIERVDEERKYLLARGQTGAEHILVHNFRNLIEDAPTEEQEVYMTGENYDLYMEGYKQARKDFERQGEWMRLDLAKRVIAKFEDYLDEDMIYRIQIALEKENEADIQK